MNIHRPAPDHEATARVNISLTDFGKDRVCRWIASNQEWRYAMEQAMASHPINNAVDAESAVQRIWDSLDGLDRSHLAGFLDRLSGSVVDWGLQ